LACARRCTPADFDIPPRVRLPFSDLLDGKASRLEALADCGCRKIRTASWRGGGSAEAAEVNALDEQAVDEHLQSVIDKAGRVDISFNAVGIPDTKILGVPLVELNVEQFSLPITTYATSYS
jgi:NAD(P)-dependent dehydrogenase (short-subunit alcohol dehydrogenase family)